MIYDVNGSPLGYMRKQEKGFSEIISVDALVYKICLPNFKKIQKIQAILIEIQEMCYFLEKHN